MPCIQYIYNYTYIYIYNLVKCYSIVVGSIFTSLKKSCCTHHPPPSPSQPVHDWRATFCFPQMVPCQCQRRNRTSRNAPRDPWKAAPTMKYVLKRSHPEMFTVENGDGRGFETRVWIFGYFWGGQLVVALSHLKMNKYHQHINMSHPF